MKASCTGGAYGQLMQAEALPADDLPDCEEQAGDTQWCFIPSHVETGNRKQWVPEYPRACREDV